MVERTVHGRFPFFVIHNGRCEIGDFGTSVSGDRQHYEPDVTRGQCRWHL